MTPRYDYSLFRTTHQRLVGFFVMAAAVSLFLVQCSKPELVGADLLDNEASDVAFTDTLTLQFAHEPAEAVPTFLEDAGRLLSRNLIGKLNDPFFGKSEAQAYSEIFLFTANSGFIGAEVDSVVLSLRIDTVGVYGDFTQPIRYEAYTLEETLTQERDYDSKDQLMISSVPVASAEFIPHPYDSMSIISRGDTFPIPPMVRMPMTQEFITDLLAQDSSTFESADSFRMWIKGLHIRMTQGENTMLGFDFRNAWSRITIFYHQPGDTINNEAFFTFVDGLNAGVHHSYFTHDYTGSVVEPFIQDPVLGDSLIFIQGMAGVNAKMSLPTLTNLEDIVINKAELEFFVAELPDDSLSLYPPVNVLITGEKNDDGYIGVTDDIGYILDQFGLLTPFGGDRMTVDTAGTPVMRYRMNVTATVQDIYRGKMDNEIYITPFVKASIPNRVILYGPGHPVYPARMRLIYTVAE